MRMTISDDGQEVTPDTPTGPAMNGRDRPPGLNPSRRGHIGWVVSGSLATGILAALLLAAAPIIPPTESGVTGAVLFGLALGWTMLTVLSARFTATPQKWAAVPALVMGLAGLLLIAFGSPLQEVLAWLWPPVVLALAVWMVVTVHRQLRSRTGRVLLYPVIVLLALASLGSGFETVREAVDAGAHPTQGQLIDVGGHRLYLNCTGSGSPTVVLEPGAGLMSSDLAFVAPIVAGDTRVCVYDRAGRGWSDSANTPQDGAQVAADLYTLLQRGNEPGPYVLAGHSFGGLYALTFAALYPDEVAALVLVDSTAPASEPVSAQRTRADSNDTMNRISALGAAAARLGIGRLFGVETSNHFRGTIDEYLHAGPSAQHAAALKNFADKPLVVLTAGTDSQAGWGDAQDALASLSTNSLHRVINEATHSSLISDKKDAAETARGILDAVSAARTARIVTP